MGGHKQRRDNVWRPPLENPANPFFLNENKLTNKGIGTKFKLTKRGIGTKFVILEIAIQSYKYNYIWVNNK